jgi:dephospho-CoA kinase
MYVIGITGGTGSGKTVALQVLEQLGALRLDCDEIYHELLKENEAMKAEIAARFNGVLENGVINRSRLGEMVFKDRSALHELNMITHKYVIDEVKQRLAKWEKQGGTVAAIDAIALIESGVNQLCDTTIGIIAPIETRVSRVIKRDGLTREHALMRINAQQSDGFYIDNCNHILENNFNSVEEFEEKCRTYFTEKLNL